MPDKLIMASTPNTGNPVPPLQAAHHEFVPKDLHSLWVSVHQGRRDALGPDNAHHSSASKTTPTSFNLVTLDSVSVTSLDAFPLALFPHEAIKAMFAQATASGPQLHRFKASVMTRDPSALIAHLFWYIFVLLFQKSSITSDSLIPLLRARIAHLYAENFVLLGEAGELSSKLGLFLAETVVILFEQTFESLSAAPFDLLTTQQIYYLINYELFGLSLASSTSSAFRASFFRARHRATLDNTFVARPFVPPSTNADHTLTTVDTSPAVSRLAHKSKLFTKDDPGFPILPPPSRLRLLLFSSKPRKPLSPKKKPVTPSTDSPLPGEARPVRAAAAAAAAASSVHLFMQQTCAPLLADAALIDAHYDGRPRLLHGTAAALAAPRMKSSTS